MLQSAEHDFGVNVNGFGVNTVAWFAVFGMMGGGFGVQCFDEVFDMTINGSNRHGFGETGKSRTVVVCISCHLGSLSISLAFLGSGDTRDVMSSFVEGGDVAKAKLSEAASDNFIGIGFGGFGMEDEGVKDEGKIAKGEVGALIVRSRDIEGWGGKHHEFVDMMQCAEVLFLCFKVDFAPEISAVVRRGWGKVGEPL